MHLSAHFKGSGFGSFKEDSSVKTPKVSMFFCFPLGVASSQEQDFGTANLHMEVSDVVSVLVYVGVAKGNGVLSKTGESFDYLCPSLFNGLK